jgi:hypothetical protein
MKRATSSLVSAPSNEAASSIRNSRKVTVAPARTGRASFQFVVATVA